MASPVLFDRLALIGVGLIGCSIARAARAQARCAKIVATARSRADAAARRRTRARRSRWWRPTPRRSPAPISSSSAFRSAPAARSPRKSGRISSPARSSPMSARSRRAVVRDMAPASARRRAFRPGASGRRHRAFRPRRRLRRTVRQPLVHPHAAEGRRPAAVERLARSGRVRRQCRDHAAGASRSGAGDHQPRAASDRLHDRRHRRRPAPGDRSEVLKFSAGGFRDFTRIAASDPTMWRDMFLPTRTRCWKCSAASTRICRR